MNNLFDEFVPYHDIVMNWKRRYQWSQWRKCLWISLNIPHTRLCDCGEEKIRRFTNNFLLEEAVERYLGVYFTDMTHSNFHSGEGSATPDFTDDNGKTYELKARASIEYAPDYEDNKEWHNADVHLLYSKWNKHLYIQYSNRDYKDLGELKAYKELED